MEEVTLVHNGEEFCVPSCLLEDRDVFNHVMSRDTWSSVLSDNDRHELCKLLPQETTASEQDDILQSLFSGENMMFGNPVDQVWHKLSTGEFTNDIGPLLSQLRQLKHDLYKQNMEQYHINLIEELLLSRKRLIHSALDSGALDNIQSKPLKTTPTKRKRIHRTRGTKAERHYKKILNDCRIECDLSPTLSSDDDYDHDETTPTNNEICLSEDQYMRMLRIHKKKRRMKQFYPELDTRGITLASIIGIPSTQPPTTQTNFNKSEATAKQSVPEPVKKHSVARRQHYQPQQHSIKEKRKWEGLFHGDGCIYEVYGDPEKLKVEKCDSITLDSPLPSGQFMSFFSLLKHVFDSLNDHKGDVNKVTEMVQVYLESPECRSSSWFGLHSNWSNLVLSALCYLGCEVGAVSSFDPVPHFVPLVDFRDRIDHWKWLGNKRDCNIELLVLCNHWFTNLNRALTVVDYTDYTPLPSLVSSSSMVHPSKPHEVDRFKHLESQRYINPHKSFTYRVHGYEAAVGPVKGAKGGNKKEQGSRARGHVLLKSERPNCVTILSLVRDACSRMPNGEGTRLDLCILLRDSQFIAENVTDSQLNNAVSGALDRLHYEKDPCVRYLSSKKLWIYLHRNRTEEEFEHISWATEAASKNKKIIQTRSKLTPKILLRESNGQIIDVSPQPVSGFGKVKSSPKDSKSPKRSQKGTPRIPKSTRSTGKRGGSRKLQHPSPTPVVSQLRPSPVSMTTGSQHSVDSDVERDPIESELPLLSTTFHKTSDDDHVSDLSSSDDNHMTFTSSFPPTRVTDLGEGYGFTEGPAPSSQWLSSNSNTSSDSD